MRFRYSHLDPNLLRSLRSMIELMRLFFYLLLQAGGNVEQAMRNMKRLQELGYLDETLDLEEFKRQLQESRIVSLDKRGRASLTPRGEREVRRDSLKEIFTSLKKGGAGAHPIDASGEGGERLFETRPYEFGDPVADIHFRGTLENAIQRSGLSDLSIREEDIEVYEHEQATSCATVLLIDVSHSMVLYGEDRITPAKRVALALTELTLTQYPKDSLRVVLFGDEAREVAIADIPYIQAGPYHTNTKAGLRLAQDILKREKKANRQIFMITDGKPSAITEHGALYKNPYGLDPKIVNRTLDEAASCRRDRIPITTFMLARDYPLVQFVNELTKLNKGRAYFASPENLGEALFVDYLRNRRKRFQ